MVTSDFKPEVEIRPFRAYAMHPAIIIGKVSVIVDLAMGQILRSTERIYGFLNLIYFKFCQSFSTSPLLSNLWS